MAVRRHRHWGQSLQRGRDPPKLGTQDSRFRIGPQAQLKFGARGDIEFGIDLGVDQFECAFVGHLKVAPAPPAHRARPVAP